jgi:hypothetical protein
VRPCAHVLDSRTVEQPWCRAAHHLQHVRQRTFQCANVSLHRLLPSSHPHRGVLHVVGWLCPPLSNNVATCWISGDVRWIGARCTAISSIARSTGRSSLVSSGPDPFVRHRLYAAQDLAETLLQAQPNRIERRYSVVVERNSDCDRLRPHPRPLEMPPGCPAPPQRGQLGARRACVAPDPSSHADLPRTPA